MNEELFEIFWSAYPKKVAKEAAKRAFKKLNPTETILEQIINALEMQKQNLNWQKEKGQFIPYPATYLNGRRWEDVNDTCGASSIKEYGTTF